MCECSDKLYSAVRVLAGDGPIKRRLCRAWCDNLDAIADEDAPEIIRPRLALLRRKMCASKAYGDEDPAVASVRKMSAADASGCASLIVAMFSELVRVKSTGERLRLVIPDVDRTPTVEDGPDRAQLN